MSSSDDVVRARSLHQQALVIDSHSGLIRDVVRWRARGDRGVMQKLHLPRIREGGVDVLGLKVGGDTIAPHVYKTERPLNQALIDLETTFQEVDESGGEMVIVTTAEEMRRAKREGKVAVLLSFEGARPIEDRLDFLTFFYRLGVRRFQLTWNFRNRVADGCGEEQAHSGITSFGIRVLTELERLGMILDLAHISESSFWAALEHYGGPVIVSHANARALCDHPRNMTDEQLKAVAARGGVVGMVFYGSFISKDNPTIEKLVDHIDHVVELVGINHIGLGCDYIDEQLDLMGGGTSLYPNLYPKGHEFPPGLSTYAETPNLTIELVRRGYADEDIRKLLGENYLRVFEEVFGS